MALGGCADFCVGVRLDAFPASRWRHKNGQITTHYSAAEIGELIDAVEKVSWSGSSAPTLTLIKNENSRKSPAVGRRENVKLV
jgi:hypothetical protein